MPPIKIQKRITPTVNANNGYSGSTAIKFANKLISGSISSTSFYYYINEIVRTGYLKDKLTSASTSTIDLLDSITDTVLVSSLGTVNYDTGILSFTDINPAGYLENALDIRISAKIEELDVQSTRDIIVVLDDSTLYTTAKRYSGLNISVITD